MQQGHTQKDPARMVEAAEIGAGGIVETGLCPAIGMGAPCGVMQQTRGPYDALPLRRDFLEQRLDEGEKLFAETGHPGARRL